MRQYVRVRKSTPNGLPKGFPKGVLIAKLNADGRIVIGHSKWCRSKDKFNLSEGVRIADDRADVDSRVPPALSILKAYQIFMGRARRYFKNAEFSPNTQEALAAAITKYRHLKMLYAAGESDNETR